MSKTAIITGIVSLLQLIGDMVKRYRQRKAQKDAQTDYDRIESDPAAEFMREFNTNKETDTKADP